MGEVEAQSVRRNERTRLVNVLAECLAQRCVQQVRRGVISLSVESCVTRYAGANGAPCDVAIGLTNRNWLSIELPHIVHDYAPPLTNNFAAVRYLSARLGVERRVPQQYCYSAVTHGTHSKRFRIRSARRIPNKVTARDRVSQRTCDIRPRRCVSQVVRGDTNFSGPTFLLRLSALRCKSLLEARDVHGVLPLTSHQFGKINRESIRVVQLERIITRNTALLSGLHRSQLLEPLHSRGDRSEKTLFLGARRVDDVLPSRLQLRIHITHRIDHGLDDARERRLSATEQPRVTDAATQNATQHITASVIGWIHPIGEQERDRARVVRDDAHRSDSLARIRYGANSDLCFYRRDERRKHVRIEVVG